MLLQFITLFYPAVHPSLEGWGRIHACISMVSFHALASQVELLVHVLSYHQSHASGHCVKHTVGVVAASRGVVKYLKLKPHRDLFQSPASKL